MLNRCPESYSIKKRKPTTPYDGQPLYFEQFCAFQMQESLYISYLYDKVTSLMRTVGFVPLGSVL